MSRLLYPFVAAITACSVFTVIPSGVTAQDVGVDIAKHFASKSLEVGERVTTLAFQDTAGLVTITPSRSAATVIVFVAANCGASNAASPTLYNWYHEYADKRVQFYFVSSYGGFDTEVRESWIHQADSIPIGHLVHGDVGSHLANRLGPNNTPEVYILDSTGTLRYRGALYPGEFDRGDHAKFSAADWQRKTPYAHLALDAVLTGHPVAIPRTKTFGCMVHALTPPGVNE